MTYGVLRNRLPYPERDYTQWLTTWKKNGRRGPREGARSTPGLTHYGFALAAARSNPALDERQSRSGCRDTKREQARARMQAMRDRRQTHG